MQKSYAAVSAEEEKCAGINNYAMMLNSEAAKLLDTTEGKDFLKCLSVACQVTIFASFDITFKKLIMEGTTMVRGTVITVVTFEFNLVFNIYMHWRYFCLRLLKRFGHE